MITGILFLIGAISLALFSPDLTAFYYYNPVNLAWFIRLFTHMVSHGNIFHLLGNFVYGLPFMLYAEYLLQSHRRFLKLFFYTGLAALVGQYFVEKFGPMQVGAVIGSSGAIFGVMGFALASIQGPRIIRLMAYSTILFHIYNQGMLTWYSIKGYTLGVAFGAHLAGLLAGVAIAIILRRRSRRRQSKGPQRRSRSRK